MIFHIWNPEDTTQKLLELHEKDAKKTDTIASNIKIFRNIFNKLSKSWSAKIIFKRKYFGFIYLNLAAG